MKFLVLLVLSLAFVNCGTDHSSNVTEDIVYSAYSTGLSGLTITQSVKLRDCRTHIWPYMTITADYRVDSGDVVENVGKRLMKFDYTYPTQAATGLYSADFEKVTKGQDIQNILVKIGEESFPSTKRSAGVESVESLIIGVFNDNSTFDAKDQDLLAEDLKIALPLKIDSETNLYSLPKKLKAKAEAAIETASKCKTVDLQFNASRSAPF